ncbi:MAG: GAF domain-containing protein [Balneolaceae bacterium]|nr:GAF domain-containing protein [Balneolaceae bacterium]
MNPSSTQNDDRHSRFELRTLLETSRLLIESHDMDFVLNNLLLITMGKLLVTRGMVMIYQPGAETYVVHKAKGRGTPGEQVTVDLGWDEEAKSRSVIRPHEDGFQVPEMIEGEPNCTFFNLRTSNNHLGYLCLGSKGNRQPLSQRETEFVESLCIISSVAIANSRMFTELRRINRMLDRKVYELNTLFDLSKDFNMMVDRGEIIRVFKFAMLGQMLIRKFFFVLEYEDERNMVTSSGIQGELTQKEMQILYDLDEEVWKWTRNCSRRSRSWSAMKSAR